MTQLSETCKCEETHVGWYATFAEITDMAPNGIGFKAVSRYYKIMGPVGQSREAFEEEEELEEEVKAKEENDETSGYEFELQREEEKYIDYQEQRKLAREKGEDPDNVKESSMLKHYEKNYHVGQSSKNKWPKKTSRTKRLAIEDSDKYWDKGIIPYTFTDTIEEANVMSKIRAKSRFHYWSCIRFVPWTSTTSQQYSLDHDNYLIHVEKKGTYEETRLLSVRCWSHVGNMKMDGQKISCCKGVTCIHELGHAIGLHHEQKSPLRDVYIRVNEENIEPEKISGYNEVEPMESKTFGYFDMASVMLYNKYAFSSNGMPTLTLFDSNMEYLLTNPDPHMYYMFKEVTSLYKCKDMKCSGFRTECKNDGYVAFIRDTCTCRCPEGLDPRTGCITVYHGDKSLQGLGWPLGEFSILKPDYGCPSNYEEGNIIQSVESIRTSTKFNLASINEKTSFDFKFCTKRTDTKFDSRAVWEPGQYCILSHNGLCLKGFTEGFIKFGNGDVKIVKKPIPDGKFTGDSMIWHFCCREDGSWKDPVYLPTKEPFTLFPTDSECQEVKDMKAEKQWFMLKGNSRVLIAGLAPNSRIARKTSVFINVCYYWPINYDCGGIVTISEKNPKAIISSPNFPQAYNSKQQCSWTIKSPENTKMKLAFDKFDIESTVDGESSFPICEDSLEVRFYTTSYCGRRFSSVIISEVNYIGLTLSSGLTGTGNGFKASVSLITDEDMCYTGKGDDYRGTVNVTRTFESCLPWTRVQNCPHHAFDSGDLDDDLVDNYCRNPGSGTKPWCYTHYEDCNRNYCDPCGLESCYDLLDDCAMLVAEEPTFCQNNVEAQRICRQSCGFCMMGKPKPVSKIKCRSPPMLYDAISTERIRRRYKVGDVVTFKCKTGIEIERRICLADGSWSGGNFVCGRCPNGWFPFQRKCYRWFDTYENMTLSNEICKRHSAVMTSIKDEDEFKFLLRLRTDVRPFWLGLRFDDSLGDSVWLEDGTTVTFNKWVSGNDKGCGYVDKIGQWKGISCNSVQHLSVICKMSPSDRTVCNDARDDCEEFTREDPGACEAHQDFAWHVCPKSCNLCNDGSVVKCPLPPTPKNVELLKKVKDLHPGTMIEYKCKHGFVLDNGNLRRACLLNKEFTGNEPVCIDKDLVPSPNNRIEIRQRTLDGREGMAYTADNDALRIHRSGKLVTWEFYSVYNGEVALQVWRPTSKRDKYKLIGQNVIASTGNHRSRSVDVPVEEQIAVKKGDMVGFFLPKDNKGGITFDKCVTRYTYGDFGNQKEIKTKLKKSSEWNIGDVFSVKNDKDKDCKIISLRAYVL
ncbi:unnamed protein product [Mytilus edulis]|uniref:Metalloendopeptidase n=1 Tax=Mytilus edulis TaxID=6550 RepID=A0A8S3S2Q2_MYTED|nr:unnamed protein product [Mytilus edulis]